jgi:hypothetical protein
MAKPAVKKRLIRAIACARHDLEMRGFIVVLSREDAEELIAYDPEKENVRFIRICLGAITAKDTAFLARRKGCRVEFWQRAPGERRFTIIRK